MLRLAENKRLLYSPRRLTNVGLILKGENKKKAGKRHGAKRPRPQTQKLDTPRSRMAMSLHEARKRRYLADLRRRFVSDE